MLDTVWGQAALKLEHRQHPTPWAQNGSQTSRFRLCNIYSLHLVTQGHMVQKEAPSSPWESRLWLVYILEAVDPAIRHLSLGFFLCGIGAA